VLNALSTAWKLEEKSMMTPPPNLPVETPAPGPGVQPAADVVLRLENIEKSFSGVSVLKDISFSAKAGRVLAIMGENGAGKSTLKNIICGLLAPDSGTLTLQGEAHRALTTNIAKTKGIAAVHQELSLFANLSVAENMYVGMLPRDGMGNVRINRVIPQAESVLVEQLGEDLNPRTKVEHLSLGKRQMVEVAKALVRASSVLIFDEPTTSLSLAERARLLKAVKELRKTGIAIIYISHFMEEVYEIADDIVVLRDGRVVGEGAIDDMPRATVEHQMVGRELAAQEHLPLPDSVRGREPILVVEGLTDATLLRDVSLSVRPGEIVGLGGLLGAGRSELTQALIGLRRATGTVKVGGTAMDKRTPQKAREAGVVLVSEDRRAEQAFLERPVRENLLVGHYSGRERRFGLLSRRREADVSTRMVQDYGVRLASIEQDLVSLSGGNQQKVIIARWLDEKPRICILDEPTKGIDVGAKAEIHRLVRQLAEEGVAVLLVSSDMSELLTLSHRVVVMHKGAAVGELLPDEYDPDLILRLASTGSRS
jgi:ABC-type sugar transport system ATPase subunit